METVRAERAIAQRTSLNDDAAKPSRRPLPEHLPREVHTYMPTAQACPECGGELRKFGCLHGVRVVNLIFAFSSPKLNPISPQWTYCLLTRFETPITRHPIASQSSSTVARLP
jgi:hypothetical protein